MSIFAILAASMTVLPGRDGVIAAVDLNINHFHILTAPFLFFDNRAEFTGGDADAALDTFFGIDRVRSFDRSCDGADRTFSRAGGTALAHVGQDFIFHKALAHVSGHVLSTTCATYSSRKYRSVERTGFGAV